MERAKSFEIAARLFQRDIGRYYILNRAAVFQIFNYAVRYQVPPLLLSVIFRRNAPYRRYEELFVKVDSISVGHAGNIVTHAPLDRFDLGVFVE